MNYCKYYELVKAQENAFKRELEKEIEKIVGLDPLSIVIYNHYKKLSFSVYISDQRDKNRFEYIEGMVNNDLFTDEIKDQLINLVER